MSNLIIEKLLAKTKRTDLPAFVPGDTVRVHVKIKEGDKERVCRPLKASSSRARAARRPASPCARSASARASSVSFPMNSRVIDKVELVRSSKVRRAKLYYLRALRGKAARLKDVDREHATAAQ